MANRVLSIEIGQSLTKVIEIDYKSNKPKIHKYFSFPTPEGTVEDGVIGEKKADFCRLLKGGLKANNITTVKTVFAVNSGSIANREVTIPIVKENKIQQLLLANSSEYFPVNINQYQLAYRVLEKDDENKQMKLQVYAIPQKLVESYEEIAKVCNLTIQAMDYVGNSIYQAMLNFASEELYVTLKVDEALSVVTIVRDGKVVLQRSVAYGLDGIIESIRDSKVIGYKPQFEAIYEYMRKNQCVRKYIHEEETSETVTEVNENVRELLESATESVRYLVGNISRVLDYYISRNENVAINHITLLGLGSECVGLSELLSNELTVPVTSKTSYDSSIQGEHAANYMACVGAAISPLDIAKENSGKKGKERSGTNNESLLAPILVFGGCILVALVLVLVPLIQNIGLKGEKESMEKRIAQLQPAQEAYETYTQAAYYFTDAVKMEAYTITPNRALLDFLKEFEEKAPSNIMLDNLTAGTTGVTMSLKANNKEEIGEMITKLREFENVGTIETSGFKEEQDDAGNTKLTCSITCTYSASLEKQLEELGLDLDEMSDVNLEGILDSSLDNTTGYTTDSTDNAE